MKQEIELLPLNEAISSIGETYEPPVYESTVQVPIRPPKGRLSKLINIRSYNRIISTICFVLFVVGFIWSVVKNGSIDVKTIQNYADLLFFEPGSKPRCERMSHNELNRFLIYLQNSTTCPANVGDPFWPYCERTIPFTADIYTCCENDQFHSLKLGSIDLNYENVLFLINAIQRVF